MLKFRLALISSPNWYAVNDINSLCIYIEKKYGYKFKSHKIRQYF